MTRIKLISLVKLSEQSGRSFDEPLSKGVLKVTQRRMNIKRYFLSELIFNVFKRFLRLQAFNEIDIWVFFLVLCFLHIYS